MKKEWTEDGFDYFITDEGGIKIEGKWEYFDDEWDLEEGDEYFMPGILYRREDNILRLCVVDNGWLSIFYQGISIGHITYDGRCHILNTDARVSTYNKWRNNGMLFTEDKVLWRGRNYYFDMNCLKSINYIYDFEDCRPFAHCTDDNIARFPHNSTPILY